MVIALKKETGAGERRGRYDRSRGGRYERTGGYRGMTPIRRLPCQSIMLRQPAAADRKQRSNPVNEHGEAVAE